MIINGLVIGITLNYISNADINHYSLCFSPIDSSPLPSELLYLAHTLFSQNSILIFEFFFPLWHWKCFFFLFSFLQCVMLLQHAVQCVHTNCPWAEAVPVSLCSRCHGTNHHLKKPIILKAWVILPAYTGWEALRGVIFDITQYVFSVHILWLTTLNLNCVLTLNFCTYL